MDEDWHAICQANYKGVEGADWEQLCFKFVEMNKEMNIRSPGGSSKAKMLWTLSEARGRGDAHSDQTYATKIVRRQEDRQELRRAHLKSPTFALPEARCGGWKC